ncbi:MAG TPA: T9SS type A sorting domain-containing protein, partial [Bacteroidia bacterium]|nr:T9SS type A sorting domain-containing protein [Bacteroidia bacterium]
RTPPFSRRSYETFQNIWSTYRDYQNADFFIGADYVTAQPEDVGVSSIVTPANNSTVTNNGPVSCYIKNFGNSPDNFYIQVNFKLANNANIVSQMYAGSPIQPGDSVLFNFTTPLVVPYSATDILYVWTSKTSDVDNSNDTSSVTLVLVGMEETSLLQGLTVYPNPAKDRLIFAFASGTGEPAEIIITDVSGRFVHAQKTAVLQAGDKIEVDLSGISAGAYFYSVQTGNKRGNGKITRLN